MPTGGRYKPETPRKGTENATNKRNIQNAYYILNKLDQDINNLKSNSLAITIGIGSSLDESKAFAFMVSSGGGC